TKNVGGCLRKDRPPPLWCVRPQRRSSERTGRRPGTERDAIRAANLTTSTLKECGTMSLNINTNSGSISTQHNLSRSNVQMNASIARLSSGMRINSSSDDAAGLAVSEGLRAQTSGFKQAMGNATQGVAMLQTADSAMQTVSDTLVRMRELAV